MEIKELSRQQFNRLKLKLEYWRPINQRVFKLNGVIYNAEFDDSGCINCMVRTVEDCGCLLYVINLKTGVYQEAHSYFSDFKCKALVDKIDILQASIQGNIEEIELIRIK